ncbi:MAG: hypothetical protein ACRETH_02800, partial [Steroidobacteraceae bacterium]
AHARYEHLPLTSDHLDIAFHRPGTCDRPMIVFGAPDMAARIAKLRALGVAGAAALPRGLDGRANALLEAPGGVALLLLQDEA